MWLYFVHQGALVHYGPNLRAFLNTGSTIYETMHHWKSCKFFLMLGGPTSFKVTIVVKPPE
jgi:hypothetical protein